MSRIVKCAHIQASNPKHDGTPVEIKEAMIQKHLPLIEEAFFSREPAAEQLEVSLSL